MKDDIYLPFQTESILSSYSFYPYYLNPLVCQGYDVRGILYNHFIHLAYLFRLDMISQVAAFLNGGVAKKQYRRSLIRDYTDDPIEYIKGNLRKNRYAIAILNAKYIKAISFDREWNHDWVIYGYDDIKQVFFCAGYAVDISCHAFNFKYVEISYKDFPFALRSIKEKFENTTTIRPAFYWLYENYIPEPINLNKIKRDVFIYAYSLLPFVFNAKIYGKYAFIFRLYHQKNEKQFDLRPLKVLCEHKRLLHQMMADLVPDSAAAREFQGIVNLANTIQMTALKYNMTKRNKQKAIDTICDALHKLRAEEPRVMRLFYRELKGLPKS